MCVHVNEVRLCLCELQPPPGLLFVPQYLSMQGYDGIILRRENTSTVDLVASRRNMRRKWRIWPCEVFLFILSKWYFTCRKILQHGAFSFTSPPKEGMLQIFIAVKNPSPRLGLNPRTSGPMASMLTISPLRRPSLSFSYKFCEHRS
jgi:hypothetical protein